jgi:general secretion pathway protein G
VKKALGFTLVELLVVMAVLGVLAAAAMPMAELVRQREKESQLRHALWEIRAALDAYKRAHDEDGAFRSEPGTGYPPTLRALVDGVRRPSSPGRHVYYLRRIPRDPFAADDVADEATWGLRSYDSPADSPRPGADVYDIHSRSDRVGLNGVPLRRW